MINLDFMLKYHLKNVLYPLKKITLSKVPTTTTTLLQIAVS